MSFKMLNLQTLGVKPLPKGFVWFAQESHDPLTGYGQKGFHKTSYRVTLSYRGERHWEVVDSHPYCVDNPEPGYCDKVKKKTIEKAMRKCISMALEDKDWWHPIVLAYYGAESIVGQVMFNEYELLPIRQKYHEVYAFRRKFL